MKNRLREIFKLKREYFKASIQDETQLNKNLKDLLRFLKLDYIMAYSPLVHEVNITETLAWILSDRKLYLPRVNNQKLEVYEIDNLEKDLEKGSYKIMEPKLNCKKSSRGMLTAIIVPGVCFDENGYRLGFGKGYYDKYLNGFLGVKIGVCYEEFLTSNIHPEDNDIEMDFVVTEKSIYAQKKK